MRGAPRADQQRFGSPQVREREPSEGEHLAVGIGYADLRKGFAPMAGVMAVIGVLLLLQPDLGAFGVIVAISVGILFLGGVNGRLFASITVALSGAFKERIVVGEHGAGGGPGAGQQAARARR